MPFEGTPIFTPMPDNITWKLVKPIKYVGRWDEWIIPAGFKTDLTTIPRFMEWLYRRYGAYMQAAILHDFLLTLVNDKEITSRDADAIFQRVMKEEKVKLAIYKPLWAAVRVGALFNPDRKYERDFHRDLPQVAFIGLLASPFVLPPAIVVGIALLFIKLFRLD